jgi:hypothetical protein
MENSISIILKFRQIIIYLRTKVNPMEAFIQNLGYADGWNMPDPDTRMKLYPISSFHYFWIFQLLKPKILGAHFFFLLNF